MNVHSIDHLNLTVKNLQASIDWYQSVFGFRVVERGERPTGSWAIIRSGDAMLCMYEDANREGPDRFLQDQRARHVIYHWGLRITDRQQWLDTVEKYNIPIEFGGETEYDFSSSWYISDPSGYSIEVTCWHENVIRFAS